jgi:two-component system response regulator HydG
MVPAALILHRDRNAAEACRDILNSSGYLSNVASSLEEALTLLESQHPHLLLLDSNAASSDSSSSQATCNGPVVAVATFDSLEAAVRVLKGNAGENLIDCAISFPRLLLQSLSSGHATPLPIPGWAGVVGESSALKESMESGCKAARSEANILLCGESGTGKELAAQAIRAQLSRRWRFRCGGLRLVAGEPVGS